VTGSSGARLLLAHATSSLAPPDEEGKKSDAEKCARFVDQAMGEFSGVNIYDIYADVCIPAAAAQVRQLAAMLRDHPAGVATRPALQRERWQLHPKNDQ